MYESEIGTRFRKRLRAKSPDMRGAVVRAARRLLTDPADPRLNVHKVVSQPGVWEARIDRANRITFEYPRPGVIRLLNHCNHGILDRP